MARRGRGGRERRARQREACGGGTGERFVGWGGAVSCNVERAHDHVVCGEETARRTQLGSYVWGLGSTSCVRHSRHYCATPVGVRVCHATTTVTLTGVLSARCVSVMRLRTVCVRPSAQVRLSVFRVRGARRAAARGPGPGGDGGIRAEIVVQHKHDFTNREQAWCTLCTP